MSYIYTKLTLIMMAFSLLISSTTYAAGDEKCVFPYCKWKTTEEQELNQHLIDTHMVINNNNGEKYFVCPKTLCGERINSTEELITHIHEHLKCTYEGCNFFAATSGSLAKHMLIHTGVQPFKCTYEGCNFTAATSNSLTRHMHTHTGEKPHKCDQCDYAATRKSHLIRHMRIHTGEKPFKCTYEGCSYATAYSSGLTVHMRIHTGEKPFKCTHEGCNYTTAQKGHLTKHMRIHTGEKPYKCDQCNYAATQRGNLIKHSMQKHEHNAEMPPAKIQKTL